MLLKIFPYLMYSISFALITPLIISIPIVGPLILIPFLYLLSIYDMFIPGDFSQTGQNVEIGFAWITLNSSEAWLFFGSFFFIIGILITVIKLISLLIPRLNNSYSFIIMVILFIFVLPPLPSLALYKYQAFKQFIELETPTPLRFVCAGDYALEMQTNGLIENRSSSYQRKIANVDQETGIITVINYRHSKNKLKEADIYDLKHCTNSDKKTLSDLYKIRIINEEK